MSAIPGTEKHPCHWYTKCSCGNVISTCGCDGAKRWGDGPVRTIPDGCAKCRQHKHPEEVRKRL